MRRPLQSRDRLHCKSVFAEATLLNLFSYDLCNDENIGGLPSLASPRRVRRNLRLHMGALGTTFYTALVRSTRIAVQAEKGTHTTCSER
jgi:hypothetical protein